MIAWLRRNPLIATLCALAAALAVVIGLETGFGTGLRNVLPPARRAVSAEAKLLPPVLATTPEQAYPETAARPLFTPTRRPAPEGAAVAKGSFTPGQFVLQGVTVAGNNRIALLREKSSGRILRVERGREVNGIKVAEVEATSVTLTQGDEKEVLSLDVQKPAAASGAAVPLGPFSGPAAAQPPASPAGQAPAPGQPAAPMPSPSQFQAAPMPRIGAAAGGQPAAPGANTAAPAVPQTTTSPMSPEELLARRRARRTQNQ